MRAKSKLRSDEAVRENLEIIKQHIDQWKKDLAEGNIAESIPQSLVDEYPGLLDQLARLYEAVQDDLLSGFFVAVLQLMVRGPKAMLQLSDSVFLTNKLHSFLSLLEEEFDEKEPVLAPIDVVEILLGRKRKREKIDEPRNWKKFDA